MDILTKRKKKLANGNVTFKCDYPNRKCKRRLAVNYFGDVVIGQQPHDMHA